MRLSVLAVLCMGVGLGGCQDLGLSPTSGRVSLDYPLPAFPASTAPETAVAPTPAQPTDLVGYRPYVPSTPAPAATAPYVASSAIGAPIDLLHHAANDGVTHQPTRPSAVAHASVKTEQVAELPPPKAVASPIGGKPLARPAAAAARASNATAPAAKAPPPPPPPPKWQAHSGEMLSAALGRMAAAAGYRLIWGFDQLPGLPLPRLTKGYAGNGEFAQAVAAVVAASAPVPFAVVYAGPHAAGHVVIVSPYKVAVLP